MADNSISAIAYALKFNSEEAKRLGWKRTRTGWVCPACKKVGAKAE